MLARFVRMHTYDYARLVAVCVLALVSILSFPSTTQAAGCYGASCGGKDPEIMGCAAGARTLATAYALSDAGARVFPGAVPGRRTAVRRRPGCATLHVHPTQRRPG